MGAAICLQIALRKYAQAADAGLKYSMEMKLAGKVGSNIETRSADVAVCGCRRYASRHHVLVRVDRAKTPPSTAFTSPG